MSSELTSSRTDEYTPRGRKEDVTFQLLHKRRTRIAELRVRGMTPETIHKVINAEAEKEGWGKITIRTVHRDVAFYFSPQNQDREQEAGLREASLAGLDKMVEQATHHIYAKPMDTWAAFEFMRTVESTFNMMNKIAVMRGYFLPKRTVTFSQTTHQKTHDAKADAVIENQQLIEPLLDLLDNCIAENMAKESQE